MAWNRLSQLHPDFFRRTIPLSYELDEVHYLVRWPPTATAPGKMRNELQYQVELCPCSSVSGDTMMLEVKDK